MVSLVPSNNIKSKVRRLYFIWLSDNDFYLEWFKKLLNELGNDFKLDLFDYNIFFIDRGASELPKSMLYVSKDIYKDDFNICLIPHSKNNSSTGYPNWASELKTIKSNFNNEKCTLFYSGPRYIKNNLKNSCKKLDIDFNSSI